MDSETFVVLIITGYQFSKVSIISISNNREILKDNKFRVVKSRRDLDSLISGFKNYISRIGW